MRLGKMSAELPQDLYAILPFKVDVHQNDRRRTRSDDLDCLMQRSGGPAKLCV